MRTLAIAAIALAGLTLSTAPARADGSNCTVWNGPFCETAHNIRHHGWQLPVVWETPRLHLPRYPAPWPVVPHPRIGYPHHGIGYPQIGTCAIPSPWSCRHRTPYWSGVHY